MARSLLPIALVFWLEVGAERVSMGDIVAQVEALSQLAGDLDARLASAGVGGLAGAVAIYERLRDVLAGVSIVDLERMARQVADLERELKEVDRRLAAVRELKTLLDRLEPPAREADC
jgi:threonine dehydratase